MWINLQGKRICLDNCVCIEPFDSKDENNDESYSIRFDHDGMAVNAISGEVHYNCTVVTYSTQKQRDEEMLGIDILTGPAKV